MLTKLKQNIIKIKLNLVKVNKIYDYAVRDVYLDFK